MAIIGNYGRGMGGGRGSMIEISPAFFRELDEFIADNARITESMHWALDAVIMGYAYVTVGFAQKKSAGPWDPQQLGKVRSGRIFTGHRSGPATPTPTYKDTGAWKIPVRRITGNYYTGWRARRLAPSIWEVTNLSREAYYIEFGINHEGTGLHSTGGRVRVRRPVLKLSIMEAVAFAAGTEFDIKAIASMWKFSSGHSPLQNKFAGIPKASGGSFFVSGVGSVEI